MVKRANKARKNERVGYHGPMRTSPSPNKRRITVEGHFTINASTTGAGAVSYSFSSAQFGLGNTSASPTYLIEIPTLTLYNTYAARMRAAQLKYVPYFSSTYVSAASSGTGCGLAVALPTAAVPTGISLDNLLGYAGVKTVQACRPYTLNWRAATANDDNAWMGTTMGTGALPNMAGYTWTGWCFAGYMAGCNASIQIGQYFFTFLYEVELPC
jgi:hypothetical protein